MRKLHATKKMIVSITSWSNWVLFATLRQHTASTLITIRCHQHIYFSVCNILYSIQSFKQTHITVQSMVLCSLKNNEGMGKSSGLKCTVCVVRDEGRREREERTKERKKKEKMCDHDPLHCLEYSLRWGLGKVTQQKASKALRITLSHIYTHRKTKWNNLLAPQ